MPGREPSSRRPGGSAPGASPRARPRPRSSLAPRRPRSARRRPPRPSRFGAQPRHGRAARATRRPRRRAARRRRRARLPRPAACGRRSETKWTASPRSSGRFGGRDGVPAPRARHAVDARLAPRLAVPPGRLGRQRGRRSRIGEPGREVGLLREPLVERLPPPQTAATQATSPLWAVCRRGSTMRRSR